MTSLLFSRLSPAILVTFVLAAVAGCAGASSDDAATSGSALSGSNAAEQPRGVLECALDFTRPECLTEPSGCSATVGGQQVQIGAEFPSMTQTFGATDASPYRLGVVVRGVNMDPNQGAVDLVVSDNRTGAELQTVASSLSLAAIASGAFSSVELRVNVPEFDYQAKKYNQLFFGCFAVNAIH